MKQSMLDGSIKLCFTAGMEPIKRAVEAVGGAQAVLAKRIGVTPQALNQWMKGLRPVPAARCQQIELATDGQVTARELRPDVFGNTNSEAA